MITDAIIHLFQSIVSKIVNLFPEAPIIAIGNGAATGTACCASLLIGTITIIMNTGGASGSPIVSGGVSGLANHTPLALLIDLSWLGFIIGCLMAILAAFFIVRILMLFWQQVKW